MDEIRKYKAIIRTVIEKAYLQCKLPLMSISSDGAFSSKRNR